MNILHICNDYTGSKVHQNLCKRLDSMLDHQVVYTYFDGEQLIGKNGFEGEHTEIFYDNNLNPVIRKIYPLKRWWVYRNLLKKINPKEIDCVFATTLFSDGGLAYNLYRQYGIPYIVAVRMTDLSVYLNHTKLLWHYGREVLQHAKKIILINKAFKSKLQTHEFSRDLWDEIKDRVIVRPNGVDSFWIEHVRKEKIENDGKVCYVGAFSSRKNVLRLIAAVDSLQAEYPNMQLTLIGENGEEEAEIRRQASQKPYIHLLGPIYDKNELLKQYRSHSIFAMASTNETFGLVYLEALSQNLRLLYSQGTGIDGLLDDVGVAVNARSVDSIANGLRELMTHYDDFSGNACIDYTDFDWDVIAEQYDQMFHEVTQ